MNLFPIFYENNTNTNKTQTTKMSDYEDGFDFDRDEYYANAWEEHCNAQVLKEIEEEKEREEEQQKYEQEKREWTRKHSQKKDADAAKVIQSLWYDWLDRIEDQYCEYNY